MNPNLKFLEILEAVNKKPITKSVISEIADICNSPHDFVEAFLNSEDGENFANALNRKLPLSLSNIRDKTREIIEDWNKNLNHTDEDKARKVTNLRNKKFPLVMVLVHFHYMYSVGFRPKGKERDQYLEERTKERQNRKREKEKEIAMQNKEYAKQQQKKLDKHIEMGRKREQEQKKQEARTRNRFAK